MTTIDDLIASVPAEQLDAARARAAAVEVEERRERERFDLCAELNAAGDPRRLPAPSLAWGAVCAGDYHRAPAALYQVLSAAAQPPNR